MLSYETCRKLKDAGFPQPWVGEGHETGCPDCDMFVWYDDEGVSWKTTERSPEGDWYLYPTLSELIEACGKPFYALIRLSDCWTAQIFDNERGGCSGPSGKTPEEAVANLYLALKLEKL